MQDRFSQHCVLFSNNSRPVASGDVSKSLPDALLNNDPVAVSLPDVRPVSVMEVDTRLISLVALYAGSKYDHTVANLAIAYQAAVEQYNFNGDQAFKAIAKEDERRLRVLLTKVRLGNADISGRKLGSD